MTNLGWEDKRWIKGERVGGVVGVNVIFLSRPRGQGCPFGAGLVLACCAFPVGAL